jgi:hypothetical protein
VNQVYLNKNGVIEIRGLGQNGFGEFEDHDAADADLGGFSGESWTLKADSEHL